MVMLPVAHRVRKWGIPLRQVVCRFAGQVACGGHHLSQTSSVACVLATRYRVSEQSRYCQLRLLLYFFPALFAFHFLREVMLMRLTHLLRRIMSARIPESMVVLLALGALPLVVILHPTGRRQGLSLFVGIRGGRPRQSGALTSVAML